MKKYYSEALILCILAIGIGVVVNMVRSDRLPLFAENTQADSIDPESKFQQITIESAITHFQQKNALFADARAATDFESGHIAGAINLPPQQSDQWFEKVFTSVDPEKTVITYCSGANCALAKQLAQILSEAGFEQIFYLADGWGQWTANNMPIEKGE